MTTQEMMNIALEIAGLQNIPEDSGIQVESQDVHKVLAGIDMAAPEMLAAKQLGYDCVARHHPKGPEMATIGAMEARDHCEMMVRAGVPVNIAQKISDKRRDKLNRIFQTKNLDSSVQFAQLLELASITIHTPADLILEHDLQMRIDALSESRSRLTLGDIIADIKTIREFSNHPQGPQIRLGTEESYVGRPFVTMSGGSSPSLEEYKAMTDAGIGTFIIMHIKPEVIDELAKDGRCNIIVTGHMPSDSYGFNRILDAWESRGVEVRRIGGIV